MGTRKRRERQEELWIVSRDIVQSPGNVFYDRLTAILDQHQFDRKLEALCRKFYKKSRYGRPSMAPGTYFRALLIGYFEGLDSERGIACAAFWVLLWMNRRRTTRPFRERGGSTGWRLTKLSSSG